MVALFVIMVALAYAASARAPRKPALGGAAPRPPPRTLDEVVRGLRAGVYSAA